MHRRWQAAPLSSRWVSCSGYDMIVMPTTPGAADAWALQATLDVLAEVRALRPEIRAAVLLNRADRTRLTKAVRDAIASLDLPALGAELSVRVTYGEATLAGQGVVDYAPGSPAAKEVEQLTAAVLAALRGNDEQAAAAAEPEPQARPAAPAPDAAPDRGARGRSAGARAAKQSPAPPSGTRARTGSASTGQRGSASAATGRTGGARKGR